MRRRPEEDDGEQHDRRPGQRAGHGRPADEHRHAAGRAAPDDVLRGAALEPHRVDDDVEGDRGDPEGGGQPVGRQRQLDGGQHAEHQAEDERGARGHRLAGQRAALGAVHEHVDVAVVPAVERVGAGGGQRPADERGQHQAERRQAAGGQHHRRHRRHEQQLDDPRLGERDVRADRRGGPGAGGGAARGGRDPRDGRVVRERRHAPDSTGATWAGPAGGAPVRSPSGGGQPVPARATSPLGSDTILTSTPAAPAPRRARGHGPTTGAPAREHGPAGEQGPAARVERPRRRRGGRVPRARPGRRGGRRLGPPRHGDEPRARRVPALPAPAAPRPDRPQPGRAATASCCRAATPASRCTCSCSCPATA